jgi:4-diphosphocytidyl-2-C-methyl-D-erythritol kinase
LDRTPNGYHNIETLFALLELHDVVTAEKTDAGIEVCTEGLDTGPEKENLAYRAAEMVLDSIQHPFGVRIHLAKSIPVQAGLGGGSSDGAATLHAVNMLAGNLVSQSEILALAVQLGSDVPFFASRAAFAIGRGRGEQLTAVDGPSEMPALVVKPELGVGTRYAYELLSVSRRGKAPPQRSVLADSCFTSWREIAESSENDFEDVLFSKEPELRALYGRLERTAPILVRLCGSGSAIAAIYESSDKRDAAVSEFAGAATVYPTAVLATAAPEPESA